MFFFLQNVNDWQGRKIVLIKPHQSFKKWPPQNDWQLTKGKIWRSESLKSYRERLLHTIVQLKKFCLQNYSVRLCIFIKGCSIKLCNSTPKSSRCCHCWWRVSALLVRSILRSPELGLIWAESGYGHLGKPYLLMTVIKPPELIPKVCVSLARYQLHTQWR